MLCSLVEVRSLVGLLAAEPRCTLTNCQTPPIQTVPFQILLGRVRLQTEPKQHYGAKMIKSFSLKRDGNEGRLEAMQEMKKIKSIKLLQIL